MEMQKQFSKTKWANDSEPAITAEQLNRIEGGIDNNEDRIISLNRRLTAAETEQEDQGVEVASLEKDISGVKDRLGDVKFSLTKDGLLNVSQEV